MEFRGRIVLVTGAAGAIGKGVAADFAERGQRFLTDINQTGVAAAVAEIKAATAAPCAGLAADVTREEQVVAVVEAAKQAFGGSIDVLVNVAGCVGQGKIEDVDAAEWDKIFAVNCKGTFLFIKHVAPLMKSQRSGKIVNYSSKSGKTGSALMAPYTRRQGGDHRLDPGPGLRVGELQYQRQLRLPGDHRQHRRVEQRLLGLRARWEWPRMRS